jgi:uncharacterized protein YjbI with pentapeptide repeats
MSERWDALPRGVRWLAGGIAAVVLAATVAWVLFVPAADWLARHDVASAKGPLLQAARDAARGRLLTLGAGLFAAAALLFTARNFTLAREGQVTDRYTKAVEQLGSDKLDVRIGGIYALERVARDSAKDHPTIMEVVSAFVREHSHEQWPPSDPGGREQARSTRPDVQAAVTAIGRRDEKRDIRPIDLSGANLPRADLRNATLPLTRLTGADLSGADLTDVDLTSADLAGARLAGADLTAADFTGVRFGRLGVRLPGGLFSANLTGTDLTGTDLTGAHFAGACLVGADLTGAHLARAPDRAAADFTGAFLTGARWPEDAPVPAGWKLNPDSGELERATDSGPAEAN